MIELLVRGNAGNQFFEYAFARYLMKKRNMDDKLVLNYYGNHFSRGYPEYPRVLDGLRLTEGIEVNDKPLGLRYLLPRSYKRLCRQGAVNYDKLAHTGLYNYPSDVVCTEVSPRKNIAVGGHYENTEYPDFVREELISELKPKKEMSDKAKRIISVLNEKQSVCILVRVWGKNLENDVRKQMSPELYRKMLQLLEKRIPEEERVVFLSSNNMKWVDENLSIQGNVIRDSNEFDIYDKLMVMTNCKYFCLSNSTFSWWISYLSEYEDKMAVLPYSPGYGVFNQLVTPKSFKDSNWIIVDQDNGNPIKIS